MNTNNNNALTRTKKQQKKCRILKLMKKQLK